VTRSANKRSIHRHLIIALRAALLTNSELLFPPSRLDHCRLRFCASDTLCTAEFVIQMLQEKEYLGTLLEARYLQDNSGLRGDSRCISCHIYIVKVYLILAGRTVGRVIGRFWGWGCPGCPGRRGGASRQSEPRVSPGANGYRMQTTPRLHPPVHSRSDISAIPYSDAM
jgi:hypothetical protein